MKRAKAVSLGLALLSGGLSAAEPGAPGSLPPGLLPAAVRNPDVLPAAFSAPNFMGSSPAAPVPSTLTDPVWVTASPPKPAPAPAPVSGARANSALATVFAPAPSPAKSAVVAQQVSIFPESVGPRTSVELPTVPIAIPQAPVFALPVAPTPPAAVEPPVRMPMARAETTAPSTPQASPIDPESSAAPKPRPAMDAKPRTTPMSPPSRSASEPLPQPKEKDEPNLWGAAEPRPTQPPQVELPTAPLAMLQAPSGPAIVPMHKGTFGSAPIRISRDYPPLMDMLRNSHSQVVTGEEDTASAPATDRVFAQVEYLLWFMNRDTIPVLGTTSTNGGDGYLGQSGTVNVIGPGKYGDSTRNGFRARAGAWIDDCGTCGIDGSFFFLGKQSNTITMTPDQFGVITRPIFVPNANIEFGQIVSFPGLSRGTLIVQDESSLWGADANFRNAICRQCDRQTEWFTGFRYLNLSEKITITENITALDGSRDPAGTQVLVQDSFSTRNDFYGGQIGGSYMRRWNRFDLNARGSIALGVTRQEVRIDAFQQVTQPGLPTASFVGGLLGTTTNIGTHTREAFSAVPEITLNAGYWLTPNLKLYLGYNFIYWSNVLRPGGEIDRTVNLSNVPNPPDAVPFSNVARPAATFAETDLAIHGIQFGAEWRW